MEREHNVQVSDRLLDLIRATRLELRKAKQPYPVCSDDGRMLAMLEAAEAAIFDVVVTASAYGYRELTDYDIQPSDDVLPKRQHAVAIVELYPELEADPGESEA